MRACESYSPNVPPLCYSAQRGGLAMAQHLASPIDILRKQELGDTQKNFGRLSVIIQIEPIEVGFNPSGNKVAGVYGGSWR